MQAYDMRILYLVLPNRNIVFNRSQDRDFRHHWGRIPNEDRTQVWD